MIRLPFGSSVLFVLVAAACGEPLKAPQLIEEPRVIGGKVEVDGAPERAWPAAGEGATVRWLVGYPEAKVPMTVGLLVCPGLPQSMGVSECAGAPFAIAVTDEPSTEEPWIHFELPGEDLLADIDRGLALGVLCSSGVPVLGESIIDSGCSEPAARPLRFSLDVGIARGGQGNRNPDLASAPVELDGNAWEPAEPTDMAGASCEGGETRPTVGAGSGEHLIALTPSPTDRESLEPGDPAEPTREALQITYLSTGGDLDHSYGAIEDDADMDRLEVTWEAPETVAEAGEIVRFYFVGRDLRGGVDWIERSVCVVPNH
ncbi:MAG: hypothetical protein JW751_13770 [Polyangiaceae bacterium]|nr:hypothetical protein [Polyangiaceae bacterium]